ncbi:MAG: FkbM family methyltransferase [Bosea sp. (in: a-proteobacteria)]
MTSHTQNDTPPFGTYKAAGFVAWAIGRTRASTMAWWSRRFAFLIRRMAISSLKGAPVDTETLGARMRVFPQSNICEKRVLFMPQFFDSQELAILADHIRPGYRFIDIGANVGAYSLFVAARAGRDARVLAVEPQPGVFAKLAINISLNPFGTIKAVACAVADKAGDLTLFLDARNEGESSMRTLRSSDANAVKVPAVPLAQLLSSEGFEHVDAMKIDVEGAEDLILEPFLVPAHTSLWPRLLILEDSTSKWNMDLRSLIEHSGYKLIKQTRLNFVFVRD